MKKISKINEYAARYLYEVIGMEIKNISEEINISVETLESILENSQPPNQNIKTKSSKTNSFIRETAVKGTKNVTIMTEAASQLNAGNKSNNSKFESSVYRPRG